MKIQITASLKKSLVTLGKLWTIEGKGKFLLPFFFLRGRRLKDSNSSSKIPRSAQPHFFIFHLAVSQLRAEANIWPGPLGARGPEFHLALLYANFFLNSAGLKIIIFFPEIFTLRIAFYLKNL